MTPVHHPPASRGARALLALLSPLWAPLFLLRGLARICGDGLLFVLESWRDRPLEVPPALRPLLDAASLLLFPVLITLETSASFLLFLGDQALGSLSARVPVVVRLLMGLPVVLLAPLWGPLALAVWALRRLLYDLVIVPAADRLSGHAREGSSRGRFSTFVALRYMRGRKASAGVSVVTGLTIGGVALGVWTLVVVLSVMAGFEADLQDKILGTNSHIVVLSYDDRVNNWEDVADVCRTEDGVRGVTPFLYSEFMLRSRHSVTGAIFKGIDPETVGQVTDLLHNIVLGPEGRIRNDQEAQALLRSLDEVRIGDDPVRPGILIGQEMATALRVTVGDTVQAVSPKGDPGPLGTMQARIVPFVVAGIFHSGMYEYDTKFTYAHLTTADRFLSMNGAVTGLEITVDDIYEAPAIARSLADKLMYPLWTRDWQKMNAPLFAALKLEKVVMGIILTFIVAVACMNIISTLIMLVVEKRREIAIMKAMGAGRFDLLKLFMVDGLLVGFIGTLLGLSGGLITCALLDRYQFIKLESDVYYLDTLPVDVSVPLVATVAVIAVAIAFLATLFPAWQAGAVDPVDGLRDA